MWDFPTLLLILDLLFCLGMTGDLADRRPITSRLSEVSQSELKVLNCESVGHKSILLLHVQSPLFYQAVNVHFNLL
ncbi:hypothetical protein VC34_04405 [Pseudomonas fluorescens]|uniref:Uncharacterized protein n=1 Tax=Pseudomonas fluorescens TaxID=294 RepID=A0A0F4TW59_PSEFL|nr:hypothetical protein VC34_04405 [Pseudomonas fluorescens]